MATSEGTNRRARALGRLAVVAGLMMAMLTASGQTVYRCETRGKASYSHEPCGAVRRLHQAPLQANSLPLAHFAVMAACIAHR